MSVNVAIVDYGLGNLYSVKHACDYVGLSSGISSSRQEILFSDALILPGVGAFGDAMASLRRMDLIGPLREFAASGRIIMGICLGLQLLMSESHEFGRHDGLAMIDGEVIRFENPSVDGKRLKVPQVGWNRIFRTSRSVPGRSVEDGPADTWSDTPLAGLADGEHMYFVHSFYAKPTNMSVVLSTSMYGDIVFASSLLCGNIFATQFHPERSGPRGLQIYREFKSIVERSKNPSRR